MPHLYCFFPFRCKVWIQNMRREDLVGRSMEEIQRARCTLCSLHFEDSQFTVPSERRRLNWNAVPTLFEVPNKPALLTPKRKCKDRSAAVPPCHLQKHVASTFLNIRFNFALKQCTSSFQLKILKRNRKMLKLTHV